MKHFSLTSLNKTCKKHCAEYGQAQSKCERMRKRDMHANLQWTESRIYLHTVRGLFSGSKTAGW